MLHLERIKLQMMAHPFWKCKMFLQKLGVFTPVCSCIGDVRLLISISSCFPLKFSVQWRPWRRGCCFVCVRRMRGTEGQWDRAVGTCSYSRFKLQTLKELGWDQPGRGGWKWNKFWSDEITLDKLMKKKSSDPTEPLNDWIPHGSTHLLWQAFDKTVSLLSQGMIPDLKIKETEGRKGQNELWAQETGENTLEMNTEVLVHSLNPKAALADVWVG